MNKEKVINEVKNQVLDSINYLKQGSYKLNGLEQFSPVWNLMSTYDGCGIGDCFDLWRYGFDSDDYDEFEPADEVEEDLEDIINKRKDVLSYVPSDKEVEQAKKQYHYIINNFDDAEILDVYNFNTPCPLTLKDILGVFHDMMKAMHKAKITDKMVQNYHKNLLPLSVINFAD